MGAPDTWAALAAPFPFEDVKVMPQTVTKAMDKALAVAYFDARAVMNRLDEVLTPAGWKAEYREMVVNEKAKGVICRLTVTVEGQEIVREDGSDPSDIEGFKGAISGALKRAFSALGNRSLYDTDLGWQAIETYDGNGGKKFKGWTEDALFQMKKRYDRQVGFTPAPNVKTPAGSRLPDGEPWVRSLIGDDIDKFIDDCSDRGWDWREIAEKARGAQVRSANDLTRYMSDLVKRSAA